VEDVAEAYGPLKVGCEWAVEEVLSERALIVRPGLIVGPYDPTNRFTYWVTRMADGGDVLAPGRPEREVQVIDGRDLATWILDMVEAGGTGVYNTVGPAEPLTMHDMLAACRDAAGSQARVEWVSDEFLLEQGVVPWTELPLWLPGDDPSTRAFFKVDSSRAVGAGLRFRPLTDTARDTLAWERRRTKPPRAEATRLSINAGIPRRREIELLEAWLSGRGSVREV
jgi:2'-hydroxyisoflavone reductase